MEYLRKFKEIFFTTNNEVHITRRNQKWRCAEYQQDFKKIDLSQKAQHNFWFLVGHKRDFIQFFWRKNIDKSEIISLKVAKALKRMTCLREVRLSFHSYQEFFMKKSFKFLNRCPGITDVAVGSLSEALQKLVSLQSMNLRFRFSKKWKF